MPCSCAVWTTSQSAIEQRHEPLERQPAAGLRVEHLSSGVPRTSSIAIHSTPSGSAPNA